MCRLGIIADIHDRDSNLSGVLEEFCDCYMLNDVLVCGDVTTPAIVRLFKDKGLRVRFVLGNGDENRAASLREAINEIGGTLLGEDGLAGEFEWNGRRVFAAHGHDVVKERLVAAAASGEYDLVCCGHTHKQEEVVLENGTLKINPGSLGDFGDFCIVEDVKKVGLCAQLLNLNG